MNTFKQTGGSRLTAILALCLAGGTSSLANAQDAAGETLKVCTHPAAGFFVRDANGAPSGLEYDLLSSFAAAAKMNPVFEHKPLFDDLLKDTESGQCQIGSSSVTVTPERQARLAFSNPYFPNRVVVVQKSTSGFATPQDVKDKRVAVVKGTLSTSLVAAIPGVKSHVVDDDDAAFQAVLKDEADALACDSAVVLHYLTLHPELGIAFPIGERSFFAFALPKGSKLVGPLNDHLKSLAKSGAFKKMLAKHFGEDNAELLAQDVAKETK
jgi:ABC-type amino acid transport substrate-binding protein